MHTTVGLCRRVLLALVAIPAGGVAQGRVAATQARQPHLGTRGAPFIQEDGLRFKDLDRNGKVDPYEDWRLTPDVRARDLVARMTLDEKAGTMMQGTARTPNEMGVPGAGGAYDTVVNRPLIDSAKVTSLITRTRCVTMDGTSPMERKFVQKKTVADSPAPMRSFAESEGRGGRFAISGRSAVAPYESESEPSK